jgi:hypothetical protein
MKRLVNQQQLRLDLIALILMFGVLLLFVGVDFRGDLGDELLYEVAVGIVGEFLVYLFSLKALTWMEWVLVVVAAVDVAPQ